MLEQVFPTYTEIFYNLFSVKALNVLKRCLGGKTEGLVDTIQELAGKAHSKQWAREKAEQLERLLLSWNKEPRSPAQTAMLMSMVQLLLEFINQLSRLEKQMDEIAVALPEVALVKSIPRIGDKLAAAIVAEIGDVKQFQDAKQLVAFVGLDPSIFSSGKFTATSSRITKRGSKRLRRSIYLAVQCGLRRSINSKIRGYFDKKRGQAVQDGRDRLRQQASPSRLRHP
ncbi:Transposase IS116/IS110/IS902 family protein [compost metagenome]